MAFYQAELLRLVYGLVLAVPSLLGLSMCLLVRTRKSDYCLSYAYELVLS